MESGDYKIVFSANALEDLKYWHKSGRTGIIKKIEKLVDDITENPASGIGKPEMLKHDLAGKYSRRINQEHRIVYSIEENVIRILSL